MRGGEAGRARAPRPWAQDSKDLQAEAYAVRVLSETLESREWRNRARSAVVRGVCWAGGGANAPPWDAGIMGYCRAIVSVPQQFL